MNAGYCDPTVRGPSDGPWLLVVDSWSRAVDTSEQLFGMRVDRDRGTGSPSDQPPSTSLAPPLATYFKRIRQKQPKLLPFGTSPAYDIVMSGTDRQL